MGARQLDPARRVAAAALPARRTAPRLAELATRGLELRAAFELECYLRPADGTLHERAYPYHGLRTALDRDLVDAIVAPLEGSGLRVEAANFENGIGQLELNIAYRDALGATDEAFLAKQAIRVAAAGLGLRASFMARPYADEPGSSGARAPVALARR